MVPKRLRYVNNFGSDNLHPSIGHNNNLGWDISLNSEGYSFWGLDLWFYINSLIKILVCGSDDIVFILDCFCVYLFC